MNNPFDAFDERLRNIEALLLEIKNTPRIGAHVEERIFTTEETAAFLKLTIPTIRALAPNIPHSKMGKRLYFSQKDLLEWIESGKRKTRSELNAEADNYLSNDRNMKRKRGGK